MSCGRRPGRYYRLCPYCGEAVWHPRWYRIGRNVTLALPPVLATFLILHVHLGWRMGVDVLRRMGPVSGFMAAAGIGLLLLPPADDGVIVGSGRELARRRAGMVLGGCLTGFYAAVCGSSWAFARENAWMACLSAILLAVCVCAAAVFAREPWRYVAGAALLCGALAWR